MRILGSATIFLGMAMLAMPAAAAESCTAATARATTIAQIAAAPKHDDCVTVTGVAWSGMLYTDIAAIYRARRGEEGNRIGFTPRKDYRRDKPAPATAFDAAIEAERWSNFSERPRRMTVTGRVGYGRRGAPANAGDRRFIFYPAEPYSVPVSLIDSEMTISSVPLGRLTRGEAAVDLVSLSPLAADSVWMPRFAAAADAIEAALRSRDEEQWVPLLGGKWLGPDERKRLTAMLDDPAGPFRDAFVSDRPATRVIFGWIYATTPTWQERAAVEARGEAEALVCWSSHPQADRLWPIAAFDADNQPGRPYACVRITYSMRGTKPVPAPTWRGFLEQHEAGLPEPVR